MGNRVPGSVGQQQQQQKRRTSSDVRDFFRRSSRQRADGGAAQTSTGASCNYNRGGGKINSSCPDLIRPDSSHQGPSKTAETEDVRPVKLKIYRSYSDIAAGPSTATELGPPTLEIRVYRRSTEGLAGSAGRAISLPRGMERSLTGGADSDTSYGTDCRPASRQCTSAIDARSSRRVSSRSSVASIGYRVSPEEFPDTETVRRKLKDFETHFISGLIEAFRCLPPLNQLAAISVAIRPDRVNQSLSLLQYLESDSIPADLPSITDARMNPEYVLTIPERQFLAIRKIKVDRLTDQRLGAALWVLQDLAREAAVELGRIFEYQLALVIETVSLRLLARHAVDCIVHVLRRRNRLLDRNTVVQGVLRGRPRIPEHLPRYISVIVGSKELKWNIYEVFKRPALRKELTSGRRCCPDMSSGVVDSSGSSPDYGGARVPPWRFYASGQSEPMLYGYRGQVVEWDFVNGHFRLSPEEEASMAEEACWRYDDFHRLYSPYHRLVGLDLVDSYLRTRMMESSCSSSSSDGTRFQSLADFVREGQSPGAVYPRDAVRLVFRPLGPISGALDLRQLGLLDDLDIAARVRISTGTRMNPERSSVMDTAKEVARRCEELRFRLDEMEPLQGSSGGAGGSPAAVPSNQRLRGVNGDSEDRKENYFVANSSSGRRELSTAENNLQTITDV